MAINLETNLFKDVISLKNITSEKTGFDKKRSKGIPHSSKLTGINLSVKNLYIRDNDVAHIWPISRYADLYVIYLVMDNISKEPSISKIDGFEGIDDGESLPFNRSIYYWKQSDSEVNPGQIHSVIQVVKSNEGIRQTGQALAKLKASTEYKSVVEKVAAQIAGGPAAIIQESVLLLTGLLGSILGNVSDTPLITDVKSFTDITGDFDNLGTTQTNRRNKFVSLDYVLTVKDANREKEIK